MMNHVMTRSLCNKRNFKYISITTSMFLTTLVLSGYCGMDTNYKEQIEHDTQSVQSMDISLYDLPLGEILNNKQVFNEELNLVKIPPKESPEITEPETEPITINEEQTEEVVEEIVNIRPNKLYCVYEASTNTTYYLNEEYQDYLYQLCIDYGFTEQYETLLALMYHESRFDSNAISKTHDYGLMQINRCNHKWLAKQLGNDNFLEPYNNMSAGVYMFSQLYEKYNDLQKTLVCYNMGEGNANGINTSSYSRGILEDKNKLVEIP